MTLPKTLDLASHNTVIVVAMDIGGRIATNDEFFAKVARLESYGVRCLGCVVFTHPVNTVVIACKDWGNDPVWLAAKLKDDPSIAVVAGPQFFVVCQELAEIMRPPPEPETCSEPEGFGEICADPRPSSEVDDVFCMTPLTNPARDQVSGSAPVTWENLQPGCLYVDKGCDYEYRFVVCRSDGRMFWTSKSLSSFERILNEGLTGLSSNSIVAHASNTQPTLVASNLGWTPSKWAAAAERYERAGG